MILHFVCPDPDRFISGGNLFNRRLMDRLRQQGWSVQQSEWPLPGHHSSICESVFYFFDSIDFPDLLSRELPRPSALLCHYLPGMEQAATAASAPPAWRKLATAFDLHLAPSALVRRLLIAKAAVSAQHILVLPPFFEAAEPLVGVENDPPRILLVANLVPVKGILPFLQALQRSLADSKKAPAFELRIIGDRLDADYAAAVDRFLAASRELAGRVRLSRPIPNADLLELFRRSDLLVSSSYFESFGMAVYEALSMGLPVLALNRGNLPYLITDGINGLLFNSLERLSEELLEVMKQPYKRRHLRASALRNRPDPVRKEKETLESLETMLRQFDNS